MIKEVDMISFLHFAFLHIHIKHLALSYKSFILQLLDKSRDSYSLKYTIITEHSKILWFNLHNICYA